MPLGEKKKSIITVLFNHVLLGIRRTMKYGLYGTFDPFRIPMPSEIFDSNS